MNTYHLEFKTIETDVDGPLSCTAAGPTLIQALAELEKQIIAVCGIEAAFHNNAAFITRDIADMEEALDDVYGVFTCVDFSAYEDGFTITRLPNAE